MPQEPQASFQPPVFIDSDDALQDLVELLERQTVIAVDTESNPLFAYRERLCLVQISTPKGEYIVDPLADLDLSRLVPVLADPSILKIFHDAEFDVLMLKKTMPVEIYGVFDTKVAAMSLGMETIGLAAILKDFAGVILNKRYQRSDWGNRPLTQGQLDYAICDTRYLLDLADDLRHRLWQAGEIHVLECAAECRRVEALIPEERPFRPADFSRIKGSDALDPQRQRVLQELFVMRHKEADRLNRPAFKVLGNEVLLELAIEQPDSQADLRDLQGMSPKLTERYGAMVLQTIDRALDLEPLPTNRASNNSSELDRLSDEQRGVHEALRLWRKNVATQRNTDASLVLDKQSMLALCRIHPVPENLTTLAGCGLLQPWRLQYYGEGIMHALANPAPLRSMRPRRRGESRGRS